MWGAQSILRSSCQKEGRSGRETAPSGRGGSSCDSSISRRQLFVEDREFIAVCMTLSPRAALHREVRAGWLPCAAVSICWDIAEPYG